MTDNQEKIEKETQKLEAIQEPTNPLEVLLQAVPSSAPLATLPNRLRPLWDALSRQVEVDPALFIKKDVKEYFCLLGSDLKPFYREYQRAKRANEEQTKFQARETEKTVLLERDIKPPEVLEAISKIGIADPQILDLVIAAYVSARLNTIPPIWLMLVGAPSSFKTELVRLIDLPGIYSLDTLSENAFASGYVKPDGSDPEDLLPLLNGKCFVIKDLTTLFSLKEDTIKKILGDLTSIFDGRYEKFTATRGNVSYSSRFSVVGCITPAILSKHHRYMHQLGGRFFFVRVPELTDEALKLGHAIAWDPTPREERIKHARQLVSSYCHQVAEKAIALFPKIERESAEVQDWISMAAKFIAHARGTTITKPASFENEKGETVDYYEVSDPQIEHSWRLLGQLRSLARVLAAMRGKTAVTKEELETLKPIVLSSMPIDRAVVVEELLKEEWLTPRETGERINKSSKTAGRDLKELLMLGLVDVKEVNDQKTAKDAKGYSLKPEYKAFLNSIHSPEIPF